MNRFFVDKNNIIEEYNKIIVDNPEDIKHIVKVLRLAEGDKIEVCNCNNVEYISMINKINKNNIECTIIDKNNCKNEPPVNITLFQSIPKLNKMDLIIQKCVELGVSAIVPILSDRCIVKIKDDNAEKKIDRWQKIALESSKQCKRGIIPKINNIMEFSELKHIINTYDLILIPYELEKDKGIKNLIKSQKNIKHIGIIIGPEGGFTEGEICNAINWGIKPVTLGPRILRTETAGIVAMSILMYELGDLGGN